MGNIKEPSRKPTKFTCSLKIYNGYLRWDRDKRFPHEWLICHETLNGFRRILKVHSNSSELPLFLFEKLHKVGVNKKKAWTIMEVVDIVISNYDYEEQLGKTT